MLFFKSTSVTFSKFFHILHLLVSLVQGLYYYYLKFCFNKLTNQSSGLRAFFDGFLLKISWLILCIKNFLEKQSLQLNQHYNLEKNQHDMLCKMCIHIIFHFDKLCKLKFHYL
jgi:hypothetical protein